MSIGLTLLAYGVLRISGLHFLVLEKRRKFTVNMGPTTTSWQEVKCVCSQLKSCHISRSCQLAIFWIWDCWSLCSAYFSSVLKGLIPAGLELGRTILLDCDIYLHATDPWWRRKICWLIVCSVTMGLKKYGVVCTSLSVSFMDNSEIDDLHLFSVSALWALPLRAHSKNRPSRPAG